MSRIGKQPVTIPSGVTMTLGQDRRLSVKGPKGNLELTLRPEIDIEIDDKEARLVIGSDQESSELRAFHGMTRALVNNMVVGVTTPFTKKLEIVGVGWNAAVQGKQIVLNIGFCHPVNIPLPASVSAEAPNPTTLILSGPNKQELGQAAATIRKVRPPEPYKGKGIHYSGEYVRRKAGKSFGA
ncbi:MAG: 50S ribosomal protein L6 [Planctomycetes bacterium]|jgi:large subunit ribosomal protein L6|nr:50S ribosomal protein L6 [Planctomycetota bacterium]